MKNVSLVNTNKFFSEIFVTKIQNKKIYYGKISALDSIINAALSRRALTEK